MREYEDEVGSKQRKISKRQSGVLRGKGERGKGDGR